MNLIQMKYKNVIERIMDLKWTEHVCLLNWKNIYYIYMYNSMQKYTLT